MTNHEVWDKTIELNGVAIQSVVCMEECSELIKAISKRLRGELDIENNLAEEMANVTICLYQLARMYDVDDTDVHASRRIGGMSGGCRSIRREGVVDMATNVTQRNEVLRELLRWHLEKERLAANRLFDGVTPPRQADVVCGKLRAHTESSNHILSMLGYPDALPPAGRCPDDLSDR